MVRWLLGYIGMALGGVAALLVVIWLTGGFEDLGLGFAGMIAFIVGITVTVVLSVGLMGLVFYSDRSGQDIVVAQHDPTAPDVPPPRAARRRLQAERTPGQ